MEAEKALFNLVCFNTDRAIRMKFIEGCLDNIQKNKYDFLKFYILNFKLKFVYYKHFSFEYCIIQLIKYVIISKFCYTLSSFRLLLKLRNKYYDY